MTEELINKLHHKSVARSIIQIECPEQNLTFRQLLIHYSGKNKSLNEKTFEKTLSLKTQSGLVSELTKDEFFNGVSAYRNPELMRIFKDLGILEGLGLGMRGIVEVYGRKIFEFTENSLYVNIPFDKEVMKSVKKSNEKGVKNPVEKTSMKIISLIKETPAITAKQIASILELTIQGVNWNLQKLKEQNKIRRVGSDKGGHWEVIE
jgi:predicted HTH transcriptional regulator